MMEANLLERAKNGDNNALEILLKNNTKLIYGVAWRYKGKTPLEDLLQEGRLGFCKAVKLYDKKKNCKFTSYAYTHIKSNITHYLRDKSNLIRVPAWAQDNGLEQTVIDELDGLPGIDEAIAKPSIAMEDRMVIRETLSHLPNIEQYVLWASCVEKKDHKEIAKAVGIRPDYVYKLVAKSKKHFQTIYMEAA